MVSYQIHNGPKSMPFCGASAGLCRQSSKLSSLCRSGALGHATGAQWRFLPKEYSHWNSVYKRFARGCDHKADLTNMNRLVTATMADIDTPKVILGCRLIKRVAPSARVLSLAIQLQSLAALSALKEVDVLFGCVDNDGARLILNELALAFNLPYIDLAVGISADDGYISSAGGRIAIVLPTGPCLYCMGEIDAEEAAFFSIIGNRTEPTNN